ncbi:MAG TPA: Uma2 family endonuclease [Gemmata sp.]|jgi:Uma2 family endonuclease|nr:Uma2 family endonuclease [Gemmata sp.]
MIVYVQDEKLEVPVWVIDHASFLKWIRSGAVPEGLRLGYINGHVWIDTMTERAYVHNRLKAWITSILLPLIEDNNLGAFYTDGMLYTCETEQFSTVPDGIFASQKTIDSGGIQLTGGARGHRDTELIGTPDLMIEVVSDNSEDKDMEWLMSKYWAAGIREYWVVDGRQEPLRFIIYRHRPHGYVATRKTNGWTRSEVLDRSFRFVPSTKQMGHKTYRLEVR